MNIITYYHDNLLVYVYHSLYELTYLDKHIQKKSFFK